MPDDSRWSRSILSPSPVSSDEDDDADKIPPSRFVTSLSRDTDLARELDLSSREDRTYFRENPFTKAKANAGKKAAAKPDGGEKTKKRGNIRTATVDGCPQIEVEKPAPAKKGDALYAEEEEEGGGWKRKQWNKGSGWLNNRHQPIPAGPPPKRSIIDEIDDPKTGVAKKGKGKAKKGDKQTTTKGKKGGKADEGVVFRKIREHPRNYPLFPYPITLTMLLFDP